MHITLHWNLAIYGSLLILCTVAQDYDLGSTKVVKNPDKHLWRRLEYKSGGKYGKYVVEKGSYDSDVTQYATTYQKPEKKSNSFVQGQVAEKSGDKDEEYNMPQNYQPDINYLQPEYLQQPGYQQQAGYQQAQNNLQQPDYQQSQNNLQQPYYQQPQNNLQQPDYLQNNMQQPDYQQPQNNMQQPDYQQPQNNLQQPNYQQAQNNLQQPDYQQTQNNLQQPDYQQQPDNQYVPNYQQQPSYQQQDNGQLPLNFQPQQNFQLPQNFQPQNFQPPNNFQQLPNYQQPLVYGQQYIQPIKNVQLISNENPVNNGIYFGDKNKRRKYWEQGGNVYQVSISPIRAAIPTRGVMPTRGVVPTRVPVPTGTLTISPSVSHVSGTNSPTQNSLSLQELNINSFGEEESMQTQILVTQPTPRPFRVNGPRREKTQRPQAPRTTTQPLASTPIQSLGRMYTAVIVPSPLDVSVREDYRRNRRPATPKAGIRKPYRPFKTATRRPTVKQPSLPTSDNTVSIPEQEATKSPTTSPLTISQTTSSATLPPTPSPTLPPTPNPISPPTISPTKPPTPSPTSPPTPNPTRSPTPNPTKPPTRNPTRSPTPNPTKPPTRNPTRPPTPNPTTPPTPRPVAATPENMFTGEPTVTDLNWITTEKALYAPYETIHVKWFRGIPQLGDFITVSTYSDILGDYENVRTVNLCNEESCLAQARDGERKVVSDFTRLGIYYISMYNVDGIELTYIDIEII